MHRTYALDWRARLALSFLGACLASLGACKTDDPSGSDGAPCGAPPGDWKYLFSCDSVFAGIVHDCTDYYATEGAADAVEPSFRALCSAQSGTILKGKCPAEGSLGSCVNTSSSGPISGSPAVALSETFTYDSNLSPAQVQSDCEDEGGVYVALDGSAPNLPAGSNDAACKAGGGATGGTDIFSVQTFGNGEIIECTNYAGSITKDELASLTPTGALPEACPEANAICSCPEPAGSGVFGTDATLIYYTTTAHPLTTCPSSDAACVAGYLPP
jgi:hypothetical protein